MHEGEKDELNIRNAQSKAKSILNETPEHRVLRFTTQYDSRKRKVESSDSETETAVTRERISSIPSDTSPVTSEAL
jgi:hypothetical protein